MVNNILQLIEHRVCVRHIYTYMQDGGRNIRANSLKVVLKQWQGYLWTWDIEAITNNKEYEMRRKGCRIGVGELACY